VIKAWKDTLGSAGCILEEFVCANCQLTVDGVKELSEGLVTNKYLKKLDISRNKLGKPGLMHVSNLFFFLLSAKLNNIYCTNKAGSSVVAKQEHHYDIA